MFLLCVVAVVLWVLSLLLRAVCVSCVLVCGVICFVLFASSNVFVYVFFLWCLTVG